MKRRNSRKCDSFDFIKLASKKPSEYVYSLHLNNFQEVQSMINQSPLLPSAQRREKYFLELPKIHSYPAQRNKSIQNESENLKEKSRLLLLGSQYKKESEVKFSNQSKKDKQSILQMKSKVSSTKDNFLTRKVYLNSILQSLNIGQIQNEKKRHYVYVEEGNNSRMVKEIIRKRPQIIFTSDKNQANIIWTRFCDFQSSKLSSRFKQQSLTYYYEGSDFIIERQLKNQTALQKQLPSQKIKQKLIISELKYHNHLHNHYELSDKKSLFSNLQTYCNKHKIDLFSIVPQTHELKREEEPLPSEISQNQLWIIKPGEDTNRGQGITLAIGQKNILQAVNQLLKHRKTALIQKYIEPLLYKNRKFDIRCFVLVVCFRGDLRAYWYKEGYLRTCCKEFNWDPTDTYAHLTNDAIQKKSSLYGKYQQANKLSFSDLEFILKSKDLSLKKILENMRNMAYHSIKSAEDKIKGHRNQFSFEIFGYDFLIDKKGKPWLIEINTNPCLQFSGSLTSRIIWHMVDNSFKICLDPLLFNQSTKDDHHKLFEDNKFESLI